MKNLQAHRSLKGRTVWTTDKKDGMVMALLEMESMLLWGLLLIDFTIIFVEGCGDPRFGRIDTACTKVRQRLS